MLAGALVGGHFSLFNPVFDRVVPEALHQADPVHGEVFELPGDAFDAAEFLHDQSLLRWAWPVPACFLPVTSCYAVKCPIV